MACQSNQGRLCLYWPAYHRRCETTHHFSLRGSKEFIYVSLECALHQHHLITQVPTALTLMTTGRSGRFNTPFGLIELTHTNRSGAELYRNTYMMSGPLPWANDYLALRDAKRTGRAQNLLLDYQQQYA